MVKVRIRQGRTGISQERWPWCVSVCVSLDQGEEGEAEVAVAGECVKAFVVSGLVETRRRHRGKINRSQATGYSTVVTMELLFYLGTDSTV